MITLSSEQGLTSVENWEDIESRPGFVTDLNPSKHHLDSIIGRYIFKDKIRCGLSNCHTLHARGYIVTTKEGLSTRIGNRCGKNIFGVDFEIMSKKFDRDITAAENRIRLSSFSLQVEKIERVLSDLKQRIRGANWVYNKTRPLISSTNNCPEVIVRRIATMVKNGTNILTIEREATSSEVETMEAMQGRNIPRPHIISEPIAEIVGLQALYVENDLRVLLVLDLETNLRAFKDKDADSMTYEELRHWTKWADTVEKILEKAVNAVTLGGDLLTQNNLNPFSRILTKKEDIALFNTYLKGLALADS